MRRLVTIAVLVLAFLLSSALAAAETTLVPSETYGVIAGVLSWPDPAFGSFPKEGRKDVALYELLVAKGVPEGNLILLLDEAATRAAVEDALDTMASKAPEGSTFLFYYAGHGSKDDAGDTYFATVDAKGKQLSTSALPVASVEHSLVTKFEGAKVLLMADCCYSGALGAVAEALEKASIPSVALTSADASNTSTQNWTFSQTVLECLGGRPLCDHDKDGTITLAELADEVGAAMKHLEHQKFGYQRWGTPTSLQVAKSQKIQPITPTTKGGYTLGQYVEAAIGAAWKPARIVEFPSSGFMVESMEYASKSTHMVAAQGLKPVSYATYPVGEAVMVEWGGKLYDAKILSVEGDFHWVTYPGWPSYWDEWVLSDRIAPKKTVSTPTPPVTPEPTSQQKAMVEWNGSWWPAVVLKENDGKYYIHYTGYDSSWDEWVGPERIKLTPAN